LHRQAISHARTSRGENAGVRGGAAQAEDARPMSRSLAAPSATKLYRSIWRHGAGARSTMLAAVALLLAASAVKLALPWLAGEAVNALQRGGDTAYLVAAGWVLAVIAIYVVAWACHGPGRVLERTVGVRVRQNVSEALYDKLMQAPLAWHERQHSGELQRRVTQASAGLHEFAQSQFVYLQIAVNFVGPLVALSLLSALTGWIAFVGYVVVGVIVLRFDRALVRLAARENDAERRYGAGLLDALGNIATLTGLRLQGPMRTLLGRRLAAIFAPLKRSIVVTEMKWCAVDLLSVVLTWSLVAAYVWQTRHRGDPVLIGSVFMIYTYAQQAGSVIGSMAANFASFAKTRADYAGADAIWQAPARRSPGAAVAADWRRIDIVDLVYRHGAPPTAGPRGAPSRTGDAANDAGAARVSGLQGVSLSLARGERVALVGPSGSGKSTLLRMLAGLYEAQGGHLAVDGVARIGLIDLGSIGTLIPQEAAVFEATVRENLAFGAACHDADLHRAVQSACFDAVLQDLPDGLETPITERGANLSGGQRQRLGLARGLLAARDASLLMLDEPTSALDPVTESRVLARLTEAFGDACIVATVHRMELLAHFDRVVLMLDGRVADQGSAAELEARQPLFREMVRRRAAPPDRAGDSGPQGVDAAVA
jgi:ABC-type multidrug transport system fused ATPase/permease subunit